MLHIPTAGLGGGLMGSNAGLHGVRVLRCITDGDADQPWVQVTLGRQRRNALLLAAFQLPQASDHFPDVWASCQSRPTVMCGTAVDDARVIERVDALDG